MKISHYHIVFVTTLLILFIGDCFADELPDTDSFRCYDKIVVSGDTKFEVLKKCGNPTIRSRFDDWWIYNLGTGRFIYYIKFANHKVNLIEVSEYRGVYNEIRPYKSRPIMMYHRHAITSPY